jgi:hypothetical protein
VNNGGTVWPGVNDALGNPLNVTNSVTFNAAGKGIFRYSVNSGLYDQIQNINNLNVAGTMLVTNVDVAAATNGMTLKLFTALAYGGTVPTILPAAPAPGLVWNATKTPVDGTVTVTNVSLTAPTLARSVAGGSMTLSWPQDHGGYRLEVQTNLLSVGLKTNGWVTVPGSTNVLSVTVPIISTNPTVFYRLVYP